MFYWSKNRGRGGLFCSYLSDKNKEVHIIEGQQNRWKNRVRKDDVTDIKW